MVLAFIINKNGRFYMRGNKMADYGPLCTLETKLSVLSFA